MQRGKTSQMLVVIKSETLKTLIRLLIKFEKRGGERERENQSEPREGNNHTTGCVEGQSN